MEEGTPISKLPNMNSASKQPPNIQLITREKTNPVYNPNIEVGRPVIKNQMPSSINQRQSERLGKTPSLIPNNPPTSVPNQTINQIIHDINRNGGENPTQLPARDIALSTTSYATDKQARPNYVPDVNDEKIKDYITELKKQEEVVEAQNKKIKEDEKLDLFYHELQSPLMIMVLFFIFQLPIVDLYFNRLFPWLVRKDGHATLLGYLVKTFIFGALYYGFSKLSTFLTDINI